MSSAGEIVQYDRQFGCVVADAAGQGFDFKDFRVVFSVRRGDNQTPNTADVRIYNLSAATAQKIAATEFTQLSLKVGYPGNVGQLFLGTIKQFRKGRLNQTDSYVDVTAADGDEAYNFAPISASFAAGAKSSDLASGILTALQAKSGKQKITMGYQPTWPANACIRGRVLYGLARDEARDFAWANHCSWSIQDGQLTFIPLTSYIPGNVPLISPSSGLIGVPEQCQDGVSLRILMNPNIKCGQCVKLDSTDINKLRFGLDLPSTKDNLYLNKDVLNTPNVDGLYYVMRANHTGDTRGNAWYTDLTCLAVDATIPTAEVLAALYALDGGAIKRY